MSEEGDTPAVDLAHEEAVEKAKVLGWVPQEEYKGDKTKWRDAEEFLDFGERLNPILRENNKRLEQELKESKAQILKIQEEVKKFADIHEQTRKQAYEQAYADLKAEKKAALEIGDYDAVVEVDEKLAQTREAEKQTKAAQMEPAAPAQQVMPESIKASYDVWIAENQWADDTSEAYDPRMEAYARAVGEVLHKKQGVPITGKDFAPFLKRITDEVKAQFPAKFENTKRNAPARIESGGDGGGDGGSKKHTYASLPQESKDACDFLVNTKVLTREQYLASYRWDK